MTKISNSQVIKAWAKADKEFCSIDDGLIYLDGDLICAFDDDLIELNLYRIERILKRRILDRGYTYQIEVMINEAEPQYCGRVLFCACSAPTGRHIWQYSVHDSEFKSLCHSYCIVLAIVANLEYMRRSTNEELKRTFDL